MGRTRASNVTSTVSNDSVEVTKNENEVVNTTTTPTDSADTNAADNKTDKKVKEIKDDDEVEVICKELAGKSVVGLDATNPIKFDEKGKAKTSGKEAKRLITIPGYSLA